MYNTQGYNISSFRKNIKTILGQINSSGSPITLINNKKVEAVVFPNEYEDIAKNKSNIVKWIALMFAEKFLGNAPSDLKKAQIKEFENISYNKLWILAEVKSLPVKKDLRSKVAEMIGKDILERLEKRYQIAKAIAEADKENLYEAVEHQTGEIEFK